MQLSLTLLESAVAEARVWETLNPDQRAAVIEILARLVAKAAAASPGVEAPRDE